MTTTLPTERRAKFQTRMRQLGRVLGWLLLVGITVLWLVPFVWMLSTALKEPSDLMNKSWIPTRLAWENFSYAFSYGMWEKWTANTVIITLVSVIGTVLSSTLVAYAFARLRWRARDWIFSLVLATMMLPDVVTMIPRFVLFAKFPAFGFQGSRNWINTFLPLTVPAFAGSSFYIFLLRQFMRSIPMELSEAAKIDGASDLRIWWSIIMPLAKPAVAAVAIFTFQGAWQDFMGPLIYLQSERLYTLQIGLRQFEHAAGGAPAWNWLMAASLVVIIPVLIIFVLFQNYFIEGVQIGGSLKG